MPDSAIYMPTSSLVCLICIWLFLGQAAEMPVVRHVLDCGENGGNEQQRHFPSQKGTHTGVTWRQNATETSRVCWNTSDSEVAKFLKSWRVPTWQTNPWSGSVFSQKGTKSDWNTLKLYIKRCTKLVEFHRTTTTLYSLGVLGISYMNKRSIHERWIHSAYLWLLIARQSNRRSSGEQCRPETVHWINISNRQQPTRTEGLTKSFMFLSVEGGTFNSNICSLGSGGGPEVVENQSCFELRTPWLPWPTKGFG